MKAETISNENQCPTITPDKKEKSANMNVKSLVGRAVLRVGEFLYLPCVLVICIIAFIPVSLPLYVYGMVVGYLDESSLGPVVKNNKADDIPPENKTFGSKLKGFIKKTPLVVGRAIKRFGNHVVKVAPIVFFMPFLLISKDCI